MHAKQIHTQPIHVLVPTKYWKPCVRHVQQNETHLPVWIRANISNDHYCNISQDFAKAGADMFTFHLEAVVGEPCPLLAKDVRVAGLIAQIKEAGMHAGIALKPSTPAEAVFKYVEDCGLDMVSTSRV